ncbi:Interactor of constitutive active ROPs 4 [Zea mays]|uniref:Interactor of constitutive active ROPs 4 n=1 Tax=Zea mays TaxID=4577 RepID=A0A3L6FG49_MAIZE|nr:hypothetical protein Zm00014a_026447 [Zea mays]PWZ31913.1 Interactor of constitutive active ROPs 4 [Zea mays]
MPPPQWRTGGAAGFVSDTWFVRFRGNEPPLRTSQRAPLHLKTTACSEANGAHHRPVADRSSPRVSPRSPLPEKKRAAGTRVAELEGKLGKVQEELKKLREQLASAEAAKKDAQVALEEAKKRVGTKGSPASTTTTTPLSPPSPGVEIAKKTEELKLPQPAAEEESSINVPATDVFEVVRAESGDKENQSAAEVCEVVSCGGGKAAVDVAENEETEEEETKKMIGEDNSAAVESDGADKESPEVVELKAKLAEKDTEIAALTAENAELKKQAEEAAEAAKKAEEGPASRAAKAEHELKEGAAREARVGEQLRASEAAREALDGELRRLRVQTEQWRKAAEAAAAVLGGDNHLTGLAGNGWGSPATMPDDGDDEGFGGKRKGAGIRVLGDLWKRKGSK